MRALITGLLMTFTFCAQAQDNRDLLYQVSTIDALLSGIYDSVATVGDVLNHGGFGLGTFDAVDRPVRSLRPALLPGRGPG
jgi:acetolactate decarboxylase